MVKLVRKLNLALEASPVPSTSLCGSACLLHTMFPITHNRAPRLRVIISTYWMDGHKGQRTNTSFGVPTRWLCGQNPL